MDQQAFSFIQNLKESLISNLGIEFKELKPELVIATMPVDKRTKQPFGLLHGGASVALAETLASAGSYLNIDRKKFSAVGMEINANHIRGVSDGHVVGKATPVHLGKISHVWDIKIYNQQEQLICTSRCTIAIVSNELN